MIVDGGDVFEILKQLNSASESERTSIIEGVRPVLSSTEGRRNYKSSLENSDLNVLFDCLNASANTEIQTASDILGQILEFIDPCIVLSKYKACLNRCLNHPHSAVKIMTMKFFRRCLETDQSHQDLCRASNLLIDITKRMADTDATVAKEVKLFLYTTSSLKSEDGVTPMPFCQPILPLLQELTNHEKEEYRLRVAELIVLIAKTSPEMTERAARAGCLHRLCREVLTDDILVQLNALEILSDFAESEHGLVYLTDQGVLKEMDKLLNQSASSPMASYLLPGFIKFFGRVSRNQPTDFTVNYSNFTNTILSLMTTEDTSVDPGMKTLAIATIGHISTTLKGKQKLAEIDGFLCGNPGRITKTIVNAVRHGRSDEKIVALNAFADILSKPEDDYDPEASSELSKVFYFSITKAGFPNPVDHMFQIIKQPFADISEAAYRILQNIVDKWWGLGIVIGQPGMAEFLLDRNITMSKQAKEVRYNLIKTLAENPKVSDSSIMPPELLNRMRIYIKQGPFYVAAQAEVALEEG